MSKARSPREVCSTTIGTRTEFCIFSPWAGNGGQVRDNSKNKDHDYTYIVLLSSKSQREDLIQGLEAGADDYLTKPFDQHELKVRLRAGTRILDLQRELVTTREELREQATKDFLTR